MPVHVGAIGGALVGLALSSLGAVHPPLVVLSAGALGAVVAQHTASARRRSSVPAVLVALALVSYGVIVVADALVLALVAFSLAGALAGLLGWGWLLRGLGWLSRRR
jgi:hypothetical protein